MERHCGALTREEDAFVIAIPVGEEVASPLLKQEITHILHAHGFDLLAGGRVAVGLEIPQLRHLGDLYAESGQTLQGLFSAVSKQASKQGRPVLLEEKKKERRDPGMRVQLKYT